jgi:hypothetical protein
LNTHPKDRTFLAPFNNNFNKKLFRQYNPSPVPAESITPRLNHALETEALLANEKD